jgi:hypothetical protein
MSTNPVIEQLLQEIGLLGGDWQELEFIDASSAFLVENIGLLTALPKRVRGNLNLLSSDVALIRRKSLMSLCRRLANELEGAIIRRRKQRWKDGKNLSMYSYKLIKA